MTPRPRRRPHRAVAALVMIVLAALLGATPATASGTAAAAPAAATAKSLYIPPSWASTGEVPWAQNRTKESADFVLLWGEKSGTDPLHAPSPYNFDPDDILNQLEMLYSFYVNTMKFTPETGLLAQYKIDVIVTQTWNRTELSDWASGGSADGKVGVINVAPGAALPGSWGLAHELGHVFQNYTFLGKGSGVGLTDPSAGTFWETSAEYMAMQVYPDGAAGDLTRFLRTENLAYSSSRHHYGNWMLVQYLVDKYGGLATFNAIWNQAKSNEHPLETYRRINNLTQAQLNTRIAEYAQHQVTYDYSNRSHFMPFVTNVYGAGFINAYNGIAVDAVDQAAGHYAVPDALAPSDYGYNKISLVPSSDGALIKLHFKGHVNAAAGSGWSYGFVAVKNGTPRYGEVSSSPDGQLSFQTQPGESEVYLVVTGTPGTVHHYAFLDGYTKDYRYPYEFRISGATPSGYEPGYQKPAAAGGGHWHSNGGGWVDNRANVASTVYVGPRAAVYGNSTLTGNVRVEGMAWVNSGATLSGSVVVKDNALVQGGANLSGTVVLGGDAETAGTCSSGTYLLFNPDRGCDGGPGETDVNPSYSRFGNDELAIDGGTTPPATGPGAPGTPSASAVTSSSVTLSWTAATAGSQPLAGYRVYADSGSGAVQVGSTTGTSLTVTGLAANTAYTFTVKAIDTAGTLSAASGATRVTTSPASGGGAACTVAYTVTNSWSGGFQADVKATNTGSAALNGWTLAWTFGGDQQISSLWSGTATQNGQKVTVANASYNAALAPGATVDIGFTGTYGSSNAAPTGFTLNGAACTAS
ncbi:MAG: avirulence protein [Streptomyces sp.]|nr:avirulence protein [Streptomyces sp.]